MTGGKRGVTSPPPMNLAIAALVNMTIAAMTGHAPKEVAA